MAARILVVEDNRDNMELMTYLLGAFGHEPLPAASGAEGIRLALREAPDLILTDIQMPEMDGYQAAASIRAAPDWRPVPIVAVTAFAMVGDRERILAAGFDGYITKPIAPDRFVSQVEAYLAGGSLGGAEREEVAG